MNITIDSDDISPLYEQIATQIKNKIITGELASGVCMPSIRQMANSLCVSIITIRYAYQALRKDGYIMSIAGKGTYVADLDKRKVIEKILLSVDYHLKMAIHEGDAIGLSVQDLFDRLLILNQKVK